MEARSPSGGGSPAEALLRGVFRRDREGKGRTSAALLSFLHSTSHIVRIVTKICGGTFPFC
jgi:hypothetical protein